MASQQGHYLGAKLSKLSDKHDTLLANEIPETDEAVSGPFRYVPCFSAFIVDWC